MTISIFPGLDQVDDVGAAFVHFEDGFGRNARGFERRGGAARGEQAEAEFVQFLAERAEMALVAVVDAEKNGALARQPLAGGELRFGEGQAVRRGDAHDFAGGAHFGTENGVHAAEFVERKDRRFHGIKFVDGNFGDAVVMHQREIHVGEFLSGHQVAPRLSRAALRWLC